MSDSAIINAPIPTAQSLCPLCHEIFLDPRILPCLHTLCLSCLNRLRPFTSTRNGSETQKSLLCPVCDSEVVLPPEGVTGLVPDMVAEEEVLREMLRSGAHEPPCDLCGEGRAQNRCQDCKVNVCEFCCQAHRRQTRTARHHLLPMQDLPPGLSLTPVPLCKVHLLEELRLFCEPCSVPACRDCALTRHQGHAVRPVAEVAGRHREHVQKAVMEVEAQLTELEAAMKGVHSVKEALNRRAELLREEVEVFTDKYISAVHEHRSRLLRDIDEEIQRRQQTLSLQGARIQQQISDLSTATSFTKGLLERAPDVHLARTQSLVLNRLQGLRHGDLKMAEMEEATGIQFSPQEEAGLCQGYRMYGGVTGRGVDPERSEVRGEEASGAGMNQSHHPQPAERLITYQPRGKIMGGTS
uniref:Uncharacterized protein n=1 Tax=Leptobrachium leishanense TaxID=445787 RepID=A0A8C5M3Y5_9ANUR